MHHLNPERGAGGEVQLVFIAPCHQQPLAIDGGVVDSARGCTIPHQTERTAAIKTIAAKMAPELTAMNHQQREAADQNQPPTSSLLLLRFST